MKRTILCCLLALLNASIWAEGDQRVHASAAYGDIGISATQDGTWFAFNSFVGARIIYFCRLMRTDSDGPTEPNCTKIVSDSYNKQMEEFGKGSYQ